MNNILLIVQKLNGGGAERAVANLSNDLSKAFNVTLVVFDGKNIAYPYSGELINLNIPPKKGTVNKIINIFKRILKVRKIKKDKDIFCSISFMPGANVINFLSKRKDIIITSERNMMSMVVKSKIAKYIIKKVAEHSDKTITLSNGVKYDLENKFNINSEKITTIYNSCNKNWFMKTSEKTEKIISELNGENKYIVTVGRLHYQKGQWHLLKAFKEVQERIPEARLIIFGTGELEEELKRLACKLEIEDKVQFWGYVKNHHKVLEKCNVFVFPSLVEGLGNVLLEAMACGVPVISTDCFSGPREIIAPNTDILTKTEKIEKADFGILVPSFSMDEFDLNDISICNEEKIMAEAIIELLLSNQLTKYYSDKSLERVQEFLPENICKQWIDVIDNLAKCKMGR